MASELFKQIMFQTLGYMVACVFGLLLIAFWQRGYFFKYIRVRTSLGKLILVKLIEVGKIVYKVGYIEENNLIWGKKGKNGKILNGVERRYIYRENNVDCIDIDGETYAFMPKEVYFVKPLAFQKQIIEKDGKSIEVGDKAVYDSKNNESLVIGVEGFDPSKVDSLIQRAQFRPTEINTQLKIIMILAIIAIVCSGAAAIASFQTGDHVKKVTDINILKMQAKLDLVYPDTLPIVINPNP